MDQRQLEIQNTNGIPEVTCENLYSILQSKKNHQIELIDVRWPDEYNGELGHIDGSKLITMGPDLLAYLNQVDKNSEIVFICRSGARSGSVTFESVNRGFLKTANMIGGMIHWNRLNYPVVKE